MFDGIGKAVWPHLAGYIVWKAQGANPQNIKLLETMLERLLNGQPGTAGDPRT